MILGVFLLNCAQLWRNSADFRSPITCGFVFAATRAMFSLVTGYLFSRSVTNCQNRYPSPSTRFGLSQAGPQLLLIGQCSADRSDRSHCNALKAQYSDRDANNAVLLIHFLRQAQTQGTNLWSNQSNSRLSQVYWCYWALVVPPILNAQQLARLLVVQLRTLPAKTLGVACLSAAHLAAPAVPRLATADLTTYTKNYPSIRRPGITPGRRFCVWGTANV